MHANALKGIFENRTSRYGETCCSSFTLSFAVCGLLLYSLTTFDLQIIQVFNYLVITDVVTFESCGKQKRDDISSL